MKTSRRQFWLDFMAGRFVCVGVFFLSLVVFGILAGSDLASKVEDNVGRPIFFGLRSRLGLDPTLDPRLKILAFDDDAFTDFGKPDLLEAKFWLDLTEGVALRNPKVILFDRVFGNLPKSLLERDRINKIFSQRVPVGSGAFLSSQQLAHWHPLEVLKDSVALNGNYKLFFDKYRPAFRNLTAYGPSPELAVPINMVGQLNYRAPGWYAPVAILDPDRVLRHLSLFSADHVEIQDAALVINDSQVPLTSRGETFLNWVNRQDLYARTKSISYLMRKLQQGLPFDEISEGDVVFVLPQMHTGNVDFKSTMIGELPGGYAQVVAANMVLNKSWIHILDVGFWGVLISCLMGSLLGYRHSTMRTLVGVLGIDLLVIALTAYLFIFHSILWTWIVPFVAFNFVYFLIFVLRLTSREILALRVDDALRGVLAPKVLERIKSNPFHFKVDSSEKQLTTMFVDFVGFSAAAERTEPKSIFEHLKRNLNRIAAIVHEHGGVVDKTVGDGLIGFFGFDPMTQEVQSDHADRAIRCALDIQRGLANLTQMEGFSAKSGLPYFPARIGINSGLVYIGDLGDQGKIDLTIIGHAVNIAKRLEDSAEPFKVLVGASTKALITDSSLSEMLVLRRTAIKHVPNLVDSYEVDPFMNNRELLDSARAAWHESALLSRGDARYAIGADKAWELYAQGRLIGTVVDYSATGLCVDLVEYFANRVELSFDLRISTMAEGERTLTTKIEHLSARVCWGRQTGKEYRHGLLFTRETARRVQSVVATTT